LFIALASVAGGSSSGWAQSVRVDDVRVGREGDRWLDTLQYQRLERATHEGVFGYAVTYDVPNNGSMTLFWPRARIHLSGSPPRLRNRVLKLDEGRLWYPDAVTGRSLPAVHRGILRLEEMYRADARGGIAAMEAFVLVFSMGEGAPVVATSGARLLAGRQGYRLGGSVVLLGSRRGATSGTVTATKATSKTTTSTTATTAGANGTESVPARSTLTLARSSSGSGEVAALVVRATAACKSRGSPRALARALKKVGYSRPKGSAVHHIVARNARDAEPARKVLRRLGIGMDDAANGVFLPATRRSPNPTGATVHSTMHTKDYYKAVNDLLDTAKDKAHAEVLLEQIRESLLAGAR
jgi:hypothetical protein